MKTERVDDIPLLIAELEKSNLSEKLSYHFPDHGNWQGIDGGKVAVIFLTYVMSRSDHRLSHVEQWASERLTILRHCLNIPDLTSKDLTDDKLGSLLDRLSDDEKWSNFEADHNQQLINVYSLSTQEEAIRLDAMISQSYRQADGEFQYGHAKQHRSDLPQLKTMVATLDPMAMPLYSVTVPGNTADDVLYLPVVEELIAKLSLHNQLFVGDSKMGSHTIRREINLNEQCYLVPLNRKQCTQQELISYLLQKPEELVTLSIEDKDGNSTVKAQAFELSEVMEDEELGFCWKERRIIVHSPAYAKRQQKSFDDKLAKAQDKLSVILQPSQGRKMPKTFSEVQIAVDKVLENLNVKEFIDVTINEHTQSKTVRKYLDRPQETRTSTYFTLDFEVNQEAKHKHEQQFGWRVYASNAPLDKLNTRQAVECYRNEYKIEHKFNELLNKVTALMPIYIQKPNRIKALIRLLLIGLKFVSLIQFQVRNELDATKQKLKELYPGNPGRSTDKPTTNMILNAFNNITLVVLPVDNKIIVKISDLKPIQLKILELLKIPHDVYSGFNELFFSGYDIGET